MKNELQKVNEMIVFELDQLPNERSEGKTEE